jgi:hypothetical protein
LKKHFAKLQEAYRKDVECAFGVLQLRFAIVQNPVRLWKTEDLWTIMIAAVILHNMIIKDERDTSMENVFDYHQGGPTTSTSDTSPPASNDLEIFLLRFQAIRSRSTHCMLKEDLINHLWKKHGEQDNTEGLDQIDE